MSDKNKSNNGSQHHVVKDSGRGLPNTATSTPMPKVQPPKASSPNKKS